LEAKQQETKAAKNAYGALRSELSAVQTALTAAQQFEVAALSHHGTLSISNACASSMSSPCPVSSPAAPSESVAHSPASSAYTARSGQVKAWSSMTRARNDATPRYALSTAASEVPSNLSTHSAWTDGGALLKHPAILELKQQRDAAVQEAARARAKLERAKQAAAVHAHTASFYQLFTQVTVASSSQCFN
jgi:hypothetical protein